MTLIGLVNPDGQRAYTREPVCSHPVRPLHILPQPSDLQKPRSRGKAFLIKA